MGNDVRPVGVFDSGIGGFSVLTEIRKQLPDESVVYVADHRFAPYGERTLDEVADRSVQVAGQLIEAGAKVVVVACNSASAAALYRMRAAYPDTPFVGMEPAVKPAALRSRSGIVGVLATAATFQGELFASVVDRHASGVEVIRMVGTGLAAAVELGAEDGPEVKATLEMLLGPAIDRGMDTLVLACTHYPFLHRSIASIAGDGVTVVDPAGAVARQVERTLERDDSRAPLGATVHVVLASTGDPAVLENHAQRLLDLGVEPVFRRW